MVWLVWSSTLVLGVIICVVICSKIEKLGLKRMGATGSLFKYE
jgi:hypothetical protein